MQLTNLEEFDGKLDGKLQGPMFILQFSRAMDELQVTAEHDHIQWFGTYLLPDSPVEEWYTSMGGSITLWSTFKTEFKAQFPGIHRQRKHWQSCRGRWLSWS